MNKLNYVDYAALALVVVGGLNWGLVGIFSYDLVAAILGDMSTLSRAVYSLVGIAAVYLAVISMNLEKK